MSGIPRSALLLGLAGLLPFIFGAIVAASPEPVVDPHTYPLIIPKDGRGVLLSYGVVILSFMSGVLWGFATKAEGERATLGYGLSVIPALWAFFMTGGSLVNLIIGFVGLLGLDAVFARWGLAPDWWMRLRVGLTSVVVICLLVGAF